jgi:hypothetical protein
VGWCLFTLVQPHIEAKIQDKRGTPPDLQWLTFTHTGKQLKNSCTLPNYNIRNESTLHLGMSLLRLNSHWKMMLGDDHIISLLLKFHRVCQQFTVCLRPIDSSKYCFFFLLFPPFSVAVTPPNIVSHCRSTHPTFLILTFHPPYPIAALRHCRFMSTLWGVPFTFTTKFRGECCFHANTTFTWDICLWCKFPLLSPWNFVANAEMCYVPFAVCVPNIVWKELLL